MSKLSQIPQRQTTPVPQTWLDYIKFKPNKLKKKKKKTRPFYL